MSWLRGALLALMTAAVAAFGLGFFAFAQNVRAAHAPDPAPEADAVVALTGGSTDRLAAGVRLLKEGHGRRLLISGVNPEVRDAELFRILHIDSDLAECCVDLITVLADLGARRGKVALQLADDAGAAGFFAGVAGAVVAGLAAALAAALAFPELGVMAGRMRLTALDLAPLIAAPFAAALIAGLGARSAAGALYARAERLG